MKKKILSILSLCLILLSAIGTAVMAFGPELELRYGLSMPVERFQAPTGVWSDYDQMYHEIGGVWHYAYSPANNSWPFYSVLPVTLYIGDAAIVTEGGTIYMVAGETYDTGQVWRWTAYNNEYEQYTYDIPDGEDDPLILLDYDDNKIYVLSVDTVPNTPTTYWNYTTVATNTWTLADNFTGFNEWARSLYIQTVVIGDMWYFFNCYNGNLNTEAYSYDTDSNTWAQLAQNNRNIMPESGRYVKNVATYGDNIYSLVNDAADDFDDLELWQYEVSTDNWSMVTDNITNDDSGTRDLDGYSFGSFFSEGWLYIMDSSGSTETDAVVIKMEVFPISDREVENPGNADTGGEGGTTESITWESPRTVYGDEQIVFDIAGDNGTAIELQLLDANGDLLASTNQEIRADGHYYWTVTVPTDRDGIIRLVEVNSGVASDWGWLTYVPDSTFISNYTYTRYTDRPQIHPLEHYVLDSEHEYIKVHWATDVQVSDLAEYTLEIWFEGDSDTAVFSRSLLWILNNYLDSEYVENDDMAAIRYMLICLGDGDGTPDYDGLIYRLDIPLDVNTIGMYQPVIVYSGSEYTETVSNIYYLESAVGGGSPPVVELSLDKTSYTPDATILISLYINAGTGLLEFDSITYSIAQVGGSAVDYWEEHRRGENLNSERSAPAVPGDYIITVTITDEDSSIQIHESVNFSVTGTGGDGDIDATDIADDMLENLENLMDDWGLNNVPGRGMLLIFGMVGIGVYFRKREKIATALILGVIGLALIFGWIEFWIVILLALAAGFYIFRTVRGRSEGNV